MSSRVSGVVLLPLQGVLVRFCVPAPQSQSHPVGPWCLPQLLQRKCWLSGSSAESCGKAHRGGEREDQLPSCYQAAPPHPAATPILLQPHWEGRSGICLPIFTAMEVIQVERKSIRCVHLCGTKEERSADRNRPGFTRRRLNKTFPQFEENGNLDLPLNISFFCASITQDQPS